MVICISHSYYQSCAEPKEPGVKTYLLGTIQTSRTVLTRETMSLQPYVDSKQNRLPSSCSAADCSGAIEKVLVLTADGRTLTGVLLSCDQLTNLVLQDTIERVIRPHDDPEDSEEVPHGLYLIRGENVAICGLLDEELDASIDWAKVRGNVVGGVKHQ